MTRLQWTTPPIDGALDEELEGVIDRDALRADVARVLQVLSPARQQAVRLRIVDGLEYRDVASRLGCSEQTARAHVSRGLRRLAKALDHQNPQSPELTTR